MTTVTVSITRAASDTHPNEPPRITGWRGLHTLEGGRGAPLGMPEILQADNSIKLPMTESIQWLCYDLAKHFAPTTMTAKKYGAIYGDATAMNNNTGYGDTPRANFPAGENLSAELPAFDKQRTFAGAFLTGQMVGSQLMCVPGVDAIDANGFSYQHGTPEAAVILQEIIERHWYCVACTNAGANGSYNFPHLLPSPVVYPFILSRPSYWPLAWFVAWDEMYYPEPLKVYL